MGNSCVHIPSKGNDLFQKLRKQFGYNKAVDLFYIAINPKFISDYKGSLSLNEEGVPSYGSFMNNSYIKNAIETTELIDSLQKEYKEVENNQNSYISVVNTAHNFNQTSPFRNRFIAVVELQDNGNLKVVIKEKDENTINLFNNQYASLVLNQRLAKMFEGIGLTVGKLSKVEVEAGRIGVTDFSVATGIVKDFGSIIRVANNMEGAQALSEEFSHLIVGCFLNDPLIQRAINMLSNNEDALKELLGEDYEDEEAFHKDKKLMAEEALGRILKDTFLHIEGSTSPTLVKRALSKLVRKFKGYKLQELENILIEAETAMNQIASDIMEGTKTISREDIENMHREVQLNALSETVDRNIEILKNALKTEQKRYKISNESSKALVSDTIADIKKNLAQGADTAFGILSYAQSATQVLKHLQSSFSSYSTKTTKEKLSALRGVKMFIDSYSSFIKALNDALGEDAELIEKLKAEGQIEESDLLKDYEIDGQTINLRDIVKELNNLNNSVTASYYRHAKPAFVEFLKPFLGSNITIKTGKNKGEKISVEALLNEANSDISFMDRWLDAMGESSDALLQLFDTVVKDAKTKARLATIESIQEIQKLRMEAESKGITNFDWMFEKDNEGNKTGNYISIVNYGQYEKDKKAFMESMDEKYGTNPRGNEAKAKLAEIKNWHTKYSASIWGGSTPREDAYKNSNYENLSEEQKDILKKFLTIKEKLDKKLPKNRVSNLKAVQKRKSTAQRMLDSLDNPSKLFDNIKEDVASAFLDRVDDDQIFGNKATALTGFDGREFMTLPVLYTNRLKDPNELSDDVFGSLMAYAYMSNNYEQMDDIIDQLEVGKSIVEDPDQRKVKQTRGNKDLIEKFRAKNETVTNFVYGTQSNIVARLNDFFESQVYGRYLKDEGVWEIFGKEVNKQKLVSYVLKKSSFMQLGFNWLCNLANVTTGIAMMNIEAASKQYFSPKELFDADKEYTASMKDFMKELTNRTKKSKLALFDALFDIKQNYEDKVSHNQKKNWFERIFGSSWAFLGQEAGDHWLYNRTAIAMAIRKKVLLNGEEMSLWDALQVQDVYEDNNDIKELNYKDIQELDGSPLDINKFSRQVAHVNHGLFGIYNEEDNMAANRMCAGRLLMQYRRWIKPQMNKRFQAGQYSAAMDEWEEGYYRTVLRLGNDLLKGKIQLGTCWEQMEDFEKRNVIRALTEMIQFFAIWILANWLEWPDDKKRPWAIKLAEYSMKRLAHETGGLALSPVMIQENLKTVKSPLNIVGMAQDLLNLFNSCVTPSDWTDKVKSGPYKGLSTFEKNFIKAPIPFTAPYKQINKFVGELDNSINYYARPTYY